MDSQLVEATALRPFFQPRSVAVIGATETPHSVGRTLLWNLMTNPFGGTLYPVNPKRSNVLGIKAYPALEAIPEPVELAIIATPASTVPEIVRQCGAAKIPAAIVISAGFKECGAQGTALETQMREIAHQAGIRILGPNCLGLMNPGRGLNATFASSMARAGRVAFISQSGALCTAVLDWSLRENVGFSAFVSLGSMVDVGWGDLIDHLGNDPQTESILIYMESVGDARSFLSAAREVALTKPIIILKVGRTAGAARAAASHTGAMTGSDAVLNAAFKRCGILRVDSIADLFSMAEVLAKQPTPRGNRLAIVTNAGGPGALATDALLEGGGAVAALTPESESALDILLPPQWSHGDPVDILGDADATRYRQAMEIVTKDANADAVLAILTPQAMTNPAQSAAELVALGKLRKPLLASWMGGTNVEEGRAILAQAGIPNFEHPDAAARAFNYMWQYNSNLRQLYETPSLADGPVPDREGAARILSEVRAAGRTLLMEHESKQLLATYGIPTVPTHFVATADEAVACAAALGYPVVVKLCSTTITHKSDVGGVHLNLENENAVRAAFDVVATAMSHTDAAAFSGVTVQPMVQREGYELIVGSSLDAQFGPVILFGTGGKLVEVYRDRALALPPLNTTLAYRLIEQTRIYQALQGVRGQAPIDLQALAGLLVRFSQLVCDQPRIKEIDINPLLASADGLVALDARVVLHANETTDAALPRTAIRPYPSAYVTDFSMRNGMSATIRPIRPEDEPLMVAFHATLSSESVYYRYFHAISLGQRTSHDRLSRICYNDYDRELALVAEIRNSESGADRIGGVGRLIKHPDGKQAEFAIIVSDKLQGQGLGYEFLRRLIEIGRAEGLQRITAEILPENSAMQRVCRDLGFKLTNQGIEGVIEAEIEL